MPESESAPHQLAYEQSPTIAGKLAILVSPRGKRYLRRITAEGDFHSNDGVIPMAAIAEAGYGVCVRSHMGAVYRVVRPTLYDLVKGVKRQTQIIYPKDIGYICMKLGVGPGVRTAEAGGGSGSLTVALSWFSGPTGRVFTYDNRPEFSKLCRRNLEWAGVGENVESHVHDIEGGFLQTDLDALFLDVRTPWRYLAQAEAALAPGAPIGFLLPTVNQVSELLAIMERHGFEAPEVMEILLRRWKTNPERMRPDDRMVAHTGFLIFSRKSALPESAPEPEAEATPPAAPHEAPLPEEGLGDDADEGHEAQ